MTGLSIYIAGPMRSIRHFNFPAFAAAEKSLRARGWQVVNPAAMDLAGDFNPMTLPDDWDWSNLPDGFDMLTTIRRDVGALLQCDAIYMLCGWQHSVGAAAEWGIAKWAGLTVYEEAT